LPAGGKTQNRPELCISHEISVIGEFHGYRFNNGNFAVLKAKIISINTNGANGMLPVEGKMITIVGTFPDNIFYNGARYLFSGRWESSRYGYQLRAKGLSPIEPEKESEILRFLSSGIIRGIGPVTASRLVEHFGRKTLDVLDNNPQAILEVKGIGGKTAGKIIASWKEQRETARLLTVLCSYGLTVLASKKALMRFGTDALGLVRENPYILTEIRGVGFLRADAIAEQIGFKKDDPRRITAGIFYCMEEATWREGHLYLPREELTERATALLNLPAGLVEKNMPEGGGLTYTRDRVYLTRIRNAETYLSRKFSTMAYEASLIDRERVLDLLHREQTLTSEQTKAVYQSLLKRLSAITGLPGTGKTYSIRVIIRILDALNIPYALCAPTGKAAKRISELAGHEATTIHRLLESKWKDGMTVFSRNEENPLSVGCVIVDELSMVDVLLMEALFRAVQGNTCMILVGDYNQLPPVGPGRVLKDIVENTLCTVNNLTQIQRQAEHSAIIKVAHAVHNGEPVGRLTAHDFVFISEEEPDGIRNRIVEIVRDQLYAPAEDTQVLSPMKKGSAGTYELNLELKKVARDFYIRKLGLVDNGSVLGNFSIGDKVIQMENNYDKDVFNGETGYVTAIDMEERTVQVLFDGKPVTYEDYELDQLGLAYALTVHKYQGSEAPCIIMPVTRQHYIMLYRNLLYTAVTRARTRLVLVGSETALSIAVRNERQVLRYSGLGA